MHGAEEFVADALGRMKRGQEVDRATLDRLVDICVSALDSAPEDARAYPLFLKAARGLIDYSPEDIEERLDVYYVQSRLVEKILGHQYEFLGMPEQDVLRANALLKDFMANIVGRIIPDYKPRPAYLNVPPPLVPPEKGFIGFNPKAVSDPEIRLEWEKRIGQYVSP